MNVRHLISAACLLTFSGCAAQAPSLQWYEPNNLDATIVTLTEEEDKYPQNAEVKRNLGIALAQAGYAEEALAKLRTSKNLDPKDPLTLYFYGYCADQTDATQEALTNYAAYMEESGKRPTVVLARIDALSRDQARKELTRALNQESILDPGSLETTTVAVPHYANLSNVENLAPLGRGLALVLLTDLAKVEELRVVERQKLSILQDEIGLGRAVSSGGVDLPEFSPAGTTIGQKERLAFIRSSRGMPYYSGSLDDAPNESFHQAVIDFQRDHDLAADGIPGPRTQRAIENRIQEIQTSGAAVHEVDPDTAARFGKLLAAGTIVMGSYTPTGDQRLQLFASVAAATGAVLPVDSQEGPLTAVLNTHKELTFGIFEALGIELSDRERRAVEQLPTNNFAAFLAFCRGLDFEARGMTAEAIAAYSEAVQLDPEFSLAQEATDIQRVSPGEPREYSSLVLEEFFGVRAGPSTQLYRTGIWVGIGPGVGMDRSDDQDTDESPAVKIDPARITIEGEIPGGGGGNP